MLDEADFDLNYYAILKEIAAHPACRSLDQFRSLGRKLRSAYLINGKVGVYMRLNAVGTFSVTKTPTGEFSQTHKYSFDESAQDLLQYMRSQVDRVVVCLVFYNAGRFHACCVGDQEFLQLRSRIQEVIGTSASFALYLNHDDPQKHVVYVRAPRSLESPLGGTVAVPTDAFPRLLFET